MGVPDLVGTGSRHRQGGAHWDSAGAPGAPWDPVSAWSGCAVIDKHWPGRTELFGAIECGLAGPWQAQFVAGTRLLVAQRVDRIEATRTRRWVDAEEEADS